MDSQGCMQVISRKAGCIVAGHQVNQGDFIFADSNGVVALNTPEADQVLPEALAIAQQEYHAMEQIKAGQSLPDIIDNIGHI